MTTPGTTTPARRPRVLHLGYEDPRKPGAGGGSVRTAEVNRRLAREFDIVVACARFPGCRPYVEDGVRYVHIGAGTGYTTAVMTYFAAQRAAVRRFQPDLVVEDFGAPLSSWGLPHVTKQPVVGVVQWLFAQEKSRQYRLPFGSVERIGVASHRDLVAVSEDLGERLASRNRAARVHVIPNGLPVEAFTQPEAAERKDILFLGRLEDAQKGVSLLLEAFARLVRSSPRVAQDLLIAGEGPDAGALAALTRTLGIEHRVRFVGPIGLEDRFEWLARGSMVVMPSRYETFGMVAAESLAVGTPVVAFDIPCLRNLVTPETGRPVPAFCVDRLADAIAELAVDGGLRSRLGAAGRESVARLTWENAAEAQGEVYRQALHRAGL